MSWLDLYFFFWFSSPSGIYAKKIRSKYVTNRHNSIISAQEDEINDFDMGTAFW